MIYSNDGSDRALRQRNFIITVVILPAVAGLAVLALVYAADTNKLTSGVDARLGYMLPLNAIIIVYFISRVKWLKIPGEGWYYIKDIQNTAASATEPAEYEEVFFESKKDKIIAIVIAVGLFAVSIYPGAKRLFVLIPAFFMLPACVLAWQSIKQLRDKLPHLKVAKQGIWTRKLGFVNWKNVVRTEVAEESKGKSTEPCLNIYLKNTVFAQAGKPDEKLWPGHFKNKEFVEAVIDHLKQ